MITNIQSKYDEAQKQANSALVRIIFSFLMHDISNFQSHSLTKITNFLLINGDGILPLNLPEFSYNFRSVLFIFYCSMKNAHEFDNFLKMILIDENLA